MSSCVPGSLYVVSGHMATIWAGLGMSAHCGWLILRDPQVTFTPSDWNEGREI